RGGAHPRGRVHRPAARAFVRAEDRVGAPPLVGPPPRVAVAAAGGRRRRRGRGGEQPADEVVAGLRQLVAVGGVVEDPLFPRLAVPAQVAQGQMKVAAVAGLAGDRLGRPGGPPPPAGPAPPPRLPGPPRAGGPPPRAPPPGP